VWRKCIYHFLLYRVQHYSIAEGDYSMRRMPLFSSGGTEINYETQTRIFARRLHLIFVAAEIFLQSEPKKTAEALRKKRPP
jgi:hypothetical protein